MVSVAQKKKQNKATPTTQKLGMYPSPLSEEVLLKFLGAICAGFREGEITDAADWGIVAKYLRAFAIYHHCIDKPSQEFDFGLNGDMVNPDLEDKLRCMHPVEWCEIMHSESKGQTGFVTLHGNT